MFVHLKLEAFVNGGAGIHKWRSSTSRPAGTDANWLVAKTNQYWGIDLIIDC